MPYALVSMKGLDRKPAREVSPCNATAMRKASRRLTQLYDDALEPCGLRSTQFAILAELDRRSLEPSTRASPRTYGPGFGPVSIATPATSFSFRFCVPSGRRLRGKTGLLICLETRRRRMGSGTRAPTSGRPLPAAPILSGSCFKGLLNAPVWQALQMSRGGSRRLSLFLSIRARSRGRRAWSRHFK